MTETLTIPSVLDRIDDARRWTTGHAKAAGFGPDDLHAIELALTEALSNVILHAYNGEPGHEVGLALEIGQDTLRLEIADRGEALDEGAYAAPDLDQPETGGYGVFLIAELMDRVEREPRPEGGTVLRMEKRRDG